MPFRMAVLGDVGRNPCRASAEFTASTLFRSVSAISRAAASTSSSMARVVRMKLPPFKTSRIDHPISANGTSKVLQNLNYTPKLGAPSLRRTCFCRQGGLSCKNFTARAEGHWPHRRWQVVQKISLRWRTLKSGDKGGSHVQSHPDHPRCRRARNLSLDNRQKTAKNAQNRAFRQALHAHNSNLINISFPFPTPQTHSIKTVFTCKTVNLPNPSNMKYI